ncbi:unnamed protein product [Didymodactylos carnosus]|uniref:Uncharacterized protein n=1 Tax=Didymodactylos carnosus TaxID=1234261 RepID=A0A814TR96_9BILA|nr:unnamed protein product [Didymodactylos carnosus]CAF3929390.1 unnamed protein product [Didymodactylos carnosus]
MQSRLSLLKSHIQQLHINRSAITNDNLKFLLDNVNADFYDVAANDVITSNEGLKLVQTFCTEVINNKVVDNVARTPFDEHEVWLLITNSLVKLIDKASETDSDFNDRDWHSFHAMASLLDSCPLNTDKTCCRLVQESFYSRKCLETVRKLFQTLASSSVIPFKYS